jgi:hypothetical protein
MITLLGMMVYSESETPPDWISQENIAVHVEKRIIKSVGDSENILRVLSNSASESVKVSGANPTILTLATTVKDRECRAEVHKRTLSNWAALAPRLAPVLFVPDTEAAASPWIGQATNAGWSVRVTSALRGNIPILTAMLRQILNESTSPFVGYANADIIFDESVILTLKELSRRFDVHKQMILITGKRRNANITNHDLGTGNNITQISLVGSKLKLFHGWAQDYFIVSRNGLPWAEIPDFVVGRNGYDNWLVATAQHWSIVLIDASKTILAIHQEGTDGIRSGYNTNHDGTMNLNWKLVESFNYSRGNTKYAPYYTELVCMDHIQDTGSTCSEEATIRIIRRPLDKHVNVH